MPDRMGIPKHQSFINATTLKATGIISRAKKAIKGRGSNMALIDAAYLAWEHALVLDDVGMKKAALSQLIKATAWWLGLKREKDSVLSGQRRQVIGPLNRLALNALERLDVGQASFEKHKSASIQGRTVQGQENNGSRHFVNSGAKQLAPGYSLERDYYLASGKTLAAAAGGVGEASRDIGTNKPLNALTLDEYAQLFDQAVSGFGGTSDGYEVVYLSKRERIRYIAIPQAGRFQRPDGQYVVTSPPGMDGARGDMWSMDRYGNLFVKDSRGLNGKGYFNHSSFNAGNEVICAGMIIFNANGVLVHIDNGSGHYQPPKSALHAACVRLQSEGADFSNVRVQIHGNPGNGFIGTTFINNPDAIQDWLVARNAGLGLP